MENSPSPTKRLLTQNLVISAIAAERARGRGVRWPAVADLSSVIDVYCLFDEAHVLGRNVNVHEGYSRSELMRLLSPFITSDYIADEAAKRVRAVAAAHVQSALRETSGNESKEKTSTAFEDDIASAALPQLQEATGPFDFGQDWTVDTLLSPMVPSDAEHQFLPRQSSYYIRTFLYLAYSDAFRIPLTVDNGRQAVVDSILEREDTLAGNLLSTLKKAYASHGHAMYTSVRQRVSPLAAIVFDRAATARSSVAEEMQTLRAELAPLRTEIRVAEYAMLNGSYDDEQEGIIRWQRVFEELKRSYGDEPALVTARSALNFGENAAKLVDDGGKAESWLKTLLSLPANVISRIVARRPVIEIHRLRNDVPASARLVRSIESVCGPLLE